MGNRFHFESKLSPEQIRAQISCHAKPAVFGWRMSESGVLYYRFYNRMSFFLIKAGTCRFGSKAMHQPVFLGKLTEEKGVTCIDGRFGYEKKSWIITALLVTLSFFAVVPHSIMPFIASGLFLAGAGACSALSHRFYAEEEADTVEWIKEHLLS